MFFEKYVKKYTHCVVFGTVSIFFYGIISNFSLKPIEKLLSIYYTGNKHIFDTRQERGI